MYITSNDWSKDYPVQGISCLVHLIFTWTGPSPAVQVDLVQGIHLPRTSVFRHNSVVSRVSLTYGCYVTWLLIRSERRHLSFVQGELLIVYRYVKIQRKIDR